ncbi:hypothetical protein LN996_00515 [Arthrobacter sp. AK01]|uniref:hypothetical protein n=1 Tax=Micrococcaceae TaxID=1268 RepID=UPI001E534BFD|nr:MULTISPECIES: hypothetical protein [Micrococcaceae]MCD4849283.1 hypothetical protein [Arthrobacter sp. AK01]MCP1414711.1 hypothetical protein [Paenarthrobacter sp. A20]
MRWDSLFDDLEAQFSAERALERESEISERARVELAAIELGDRLRAVAGSGIKIVLADGSIIRGSLRHVGGEWLGLVDGSREWLVPCASVLSYEGLGRSVRKPLSPMQRSLGISAALRALARDRAELIVYLSARTGDGYKVQGVIDRVGRDHFDLAVVPDGEVRRVGNVRAVLTIPFSSLAALSSAGGQDLPRGNY